MIKSEIQKAIDEKIPVIIENSYLFSDKPTIIKNFCGNPDYVNVEGSNDAYETYRLRFEKPLEQELNDVKEGVSVIVGSHRSDCVTSRWRAQGMTPIDWNVVDVKLVRCTNKGRELSEYEMEYTREAISVWYEFRCLDELCSCKKRVKASFVATL